MAKKKKSKKKPQAETVDYVALMRASNEGAKAASAAQVRASVAAYPELERLQLGTIQKIAGNLDNQYSRDALAGVNRTLGDASTIRGLGADMRGMAGEIGGIGRQLQAQSGETAIERALRQQAEAELALGRSLSAEEMRDASQSARAAFAARGLGTSMPGASAEILNRDRYAQAREAARRNFAASTNQMVTGNVTGRLGQAAGVLGSAANVQQGVANAYSQGATIDANAAQMRANLDPYQRALGNAAIGSQLGGNLMQSTGQTWQGAQNLAGDAFSFNANAQNWQNFNRFGGGGAGGGGGMGFNAGGAAMGALSGAASGAMIGSVVPGIGTAVGAIGGAIIGGAGGGISDEREKTDIKPLGAVTSVLNIPAYEYRYKGEKKKRKGVMAQDVAKVLPEAVTEVDYQGKRRLAIKPQVIGAALAQELTNQTKAVAA